ncbi:hypothetical protein WISP_52989 [Willisornis vidua]|uniref:Reverse transcriptase n=1 Tax=Willisornis vidua TaxID=1566151 RepID=A0ABQ9DD67_9PASS|nr:hypothetical protein WISP_52989 [Willisornis vidua]
MSLDGIHPRVTRKLVVELTKPFSIIYQQSWLTKSVPEDWKLANVTPIHKKGQKEDPRNYRLASLTSVPGKVIEEIIPSAITWQLQDRQRIRPSHHEFRKGSETFQVDYCFQLWSPQKMKDINLLKQVQNGATKMIRGMEQLFYEERLKVHPDERKLHKDLIATFQDLKGLYKRN